MKTTIIISGLAILLLFCSCNNTSKLNNSEAKQPYNVILVLADDVGWSDLACYGNQFIETPNLDAMAREGIRFTNGYAAAPLCSPSRASIITGNNPARINLTEHLHGYSEPGPGVPLITPRIVTGLPKSLISIPEALKPAGYETGHFGKWHLGMGNSSPAANGFNKVYGGGAEGLPKTFFYPFFNGTPYKDLLNDSKEGDYLDDALTNKAIEFINEKKSSPFFVELNFYSAHVPIEGKKDLVKKYADKRARTQFKGLPEDEYAAMVETIDYNVGRLLDFLKQSGLDKNTVVVFTSDNGGLNVEEVPAFAKHTPPTSNAPLRGGKGYIYEGGIREPWIVWGPSLIKKTGVNEAIITTDDFYNTVMDLAAVNSKSPDGISMVPIWLGEKTKPKNYYLNFPHYSPQRGKPGAVIRQGNCKLIEWYQDGKLELYDLSKDEGETNDLAASNPSLVKTMKAELDAWRKSLNAKLPEPNPKYQSGKN